MEVVGGRKTRLDATSLEIIADSLIDQSIAPSTKRTYEVGQRQYCRFCGDIGVPALPASEQILILFVADLSQTVVIRTYLAEVRHLHVAAGCGDPMNGRLKLVLLLRGVRRSKPTRQN